MVVDDNEEDKVVLSVVFLVILFRSETDEVAIRDDEVELFLDKFNSAVGFRPDADEADDDVVVVVVDLVADRLIVPVLFGSGVFCDDTSRSN